MLENVKECPLRDVRRHTFIIVQVPVRCALENSGYVERFNGKHGKREWRSSAGGKGQEGRTEDHRQGHRSMNENFRRCPAAEPSDPLYNGTAGVGLVGLSAK